MRKFEIGIYNQSVIDKLKRGERSMRIHEDWAETRYIEMRASDLSDARHRAMRKYPPQDGFVIVSIDALDG